MCPNISEQQTVYLDYNATTPCAPEVFDAMLPFFRMEYGNPSSVHIMGRKAANAISIARQHIAAAIGAASDDVFFTSGATESNNIVLMGLVGPSSARNRILVSSIEHKSILEPCSRLAERGFEILKIPATRYGIVDVRAFQDLVDAKTLLVSVQGANNEIGTLQPVRELADIAHTNGAIVHCDASQMLGKMPVSVIDMGVDCASFSGHKVYGPKGVGILYMHRRVMNRVVQPLSFGGGQEREFRPGTLNVPAIVGFGEACRIALPSLSEEMRRIGSLRDSLETQLLDRCSGAFVVGVKSRRLPGTSSICIPGVPADALVARTPRVCVGIGSACTAGASSPSHVLLACGLSRETAAFVIRISLGRYTTQEEVAFAVGRLTESVDAIRHYRVGEMHAPVISDGTYEK